MLPGRVQVVLTDDDGEVGLRGWSGVRCHHSGCGFDHRDRTPVEKHVTNRHKDARPDLKRLGGFWRNMRAMVKKNPRRTIAQALSEGELWRCDIEGCGHLFSTQKSLREHFRRRTEGKENTSRMGCPDDTVEAGMGSM
jgi:hypothetical protein